MTTVHKLVPVPLQTNYTLPSGARVLSVRAQGDNICIWYLCDPAKPPVARTFRAFGTGDAIPTDLAPVSSSLARRT